MDSFSKKRDLIFLSKRIKINLITRVLRNAKSSKVVPKAFCLGIFVVNNPLGTVILGGEEVVVDDVVVEGVDVVVEGVDVVVEGVDVVVLVVDVVDEVVEVVVAAEFAEDVPVDIGLKISTKGFSGLAVMGMFREFTSSCKNST